MNHIIEPFAQALEQHEVIISFLKAKKQFESSDEVIRLAAELRTKSQILQKKQYDGSLTEADIIPFKELQNTYNQLLEVKHYKTASNKASEFLRGINETISTECGMNFASNASASSCC